MPVDIFEGVEMAVACGHQLNDSYRRVSGMARRFLKYIPTQKIRLDFGGKPFNKLRSTDPRHELQQSFGSDVIDHIQYSPYKGRPNALPVSYTHLTLPTIYSV